MLYKQNTLALGTILTDEYRILQYNGHGGLSLTYLAEHLTDGRTPLVKELFDAEYMERTSPDTSMHIRDAVFLSEYLIDRQRFLSEWEIMKLFKEYPGAAIPIDYIEANNTVCRVNSPLMSTSIDT